MVVAAVDTVVGNGRSKRKKRRKKKITKTMESIVSINTLPTTLFLVATLITPVGALASVLHRCGIGESVSSSYLTT
jgi:hypothetical protein